MKELKGKTAVITGAASGIGRALARHAAGQGMNVGIADMNSGALETLKREFDDKGVPCVSAVVDVSDADSVNEFAGRCFSQFQTVELVFNNAGILRIGSCWEQSPDDWQKMLNVNVMGVVNGINAFVPQMIEADTEGYVVNTGSVGSLVAAPNMGQYTACKMAVRGLTESLYHELQAIEAPIGVSLLCPGPVLTSISDPLMGIETGSEVVESDQHMMAGTPGFITPEDVAGIAFDAVAAQKFWIFTHPFNNHYRGLTDAMIAGENPKYGEVVFDS